MLTDQNGGNGMVMPVSPMYGGGGGSGFFGGDWAWIILLLLIGGNGWGFGGFGGAGMMMPWMMGGMGGFGMDYLYPWLNNSQHISDGFRDQQLNTQIAGLGNQLNTLQLGQCQTGNAITGAVRDGTYALNNTMQGGFANLAAGTADLKYTVAQEGCSDRAALAQGLQQQTMQGVVNTNTLMSALRDGFQSLKDEFCVDRIEGYKRQVADRDREIDTLNSRLNYANEQAARVAQTAQIVDNIYNRLSQCPVNTVSVYGNQPVFRCAGPVTANGNNCPGCAGNGFGYAA